MQNSQYITRNKKGMAMSIDALLALIVFIAMVAFISTEPASELPLTQPSLAVNQIVDDAISAIESTGYIMETIENSSGKTKVEMEGEMQQKLQEMLPEQIDFRIEMLQYQSALDDPATSEACRAAGASFEDCFPTEADNPTMFIEVGSSPPADKDLFHGRKIFIKKEPGDCGSVGFKKKETLPESVLEKIKPTYTIAYFLEGICSNEIDDDGDGLIDCDDPDCVLDVACIGMTFSFGSSIKVGGLDVTEISCDEEADIELRVERGSNTRVPVDVIFAASKNASMAECAIAAGREGAALLLDDMESGVTRNNFGAAPAFTFTVGAEDPPGALDTVITWQGTVCTPGSTCPEVKLKSPTGIWYGAEEAGTTQLNSQACNENAVGDKAEQSVRAYYYNNRKYYDYLALGSALAETGNWEVYVKNTIPVDYTIKIKYIGNMHWIDTNPATTAAWDEPISKVDIAKVLITDFANNAEWQTQDGNVDMRDKWAYAEIGNQSATAGGEKSAIQPNSGLNDATDFGPPESSQMKNLDTSILSIPAPSYADTLIEIINPELYDAHDSEWNFHTKFAIIFGDSSDNTTDTYNISDAIAELDKDGDGYNDIFYYTIDFSNEVIPGNANCQNQDLYDLGWDTGGRCYAASNESALQAILNIISMEIGDKAGIDPDPLATTLTLDFPGDFQESFFNDSISDSYTWNEATRSLTFSPVTIINGLWTSNFKLLIPCDFGGCENFFTEGKTIEMPPATSPESTTLYYEIGGIGQETVLWPAEDSTTATLNYRDIIVEFVAGYFYGLNDITVDYRISNTGNMTVDLGDIIPTVNFHTNDFSSMACDPAFYTNLGFENLENVLAPDESTEEKVTLVESGYICIFLNENQDVSDCSGNNSIVVQCDIPKTYVYVLDYWAWSK